MRKHFFKVCFWITNLKLKYKKFNFELVTRWLNFYFPTFDLLTQSWKQKTSLWVTTSMVELLFFHFLVIKSNLENRKFYFELLTWSWTLHLLNMVSKFPETFYYHEVWNSRVTNLSHDIELRKMTPHIKFITRWLNFYFSTFELLTPSWKIKSFTLQYLLEVEKIKCFSSCYQLNG